MSQAKARREGKRGSPSVRRAPPRRGAPRAGLVGVAAASCRADLAATLSHLVAMVDMSGSQPCRAGGSGHHRASRPTFSAEAPPAAAHAAQDRNSAAAALEAAGEPQFRMSNPRRSRRCRNSRSSQDKTEQQTSRDQSKSSNSQDFAALLNKLTAPAKPPKNAKAGPRTIQGIGAANAMTADLADALKSQIYQLLEPAGGRAQRQRPGGGFRSQAQSGRHRGVGTVRRLCRTPTPAIPIHRAAAEAGQAGHLSSASPIGCRPIVTAMERNQPIALRSAPDDESIKRLPYWTPMSDG